MNSFLSLVEAEIGKNYAIDMIEDDCSRVMRRMGDFGFFPDAKVVLLKKSMFGGSVLIALDGVKMMMRSELAEKIVVRRVK